MSDLISNYKILPKQNLVIQYHKGVLNLNNYINFAKKLYSDVNYSPNLNHIIHIKNAKLKASFNDLNAYTKFSDDNFKKPKNRYIAVITKTPNQVVIPTLFRILSKNTSQNIEIFSTYKAAEEWLEIDKNTLQKVLK